MSFAAFVQVMCGGDLVAFVGLLAPIAFVFALAALAQVGTLKKEVEHLKEEMDALKKKEPAQ